MSDMMLEIIYAGMMDNGSTYWVSKPLDTLANFGCGHAKGMEQTKYIRADLAPQPAPDLEAYKDAVRILHAALSGLKIAYKDDPAIFNTCERALKAAQGVIGRRK